MKSECPRPESNPSAFLTFKPHARFVESGSLRGQASLHKNELALAWLPSGTVLPGYRGGGDRPAVML